MNPEPSSMSDSEAREVVRRILATWPTPAIPDESVEEWIRILSEHDTDYETASAFLWRRISDQTQSARRPEITEVVRGAKPRRQPAPEIDMGQYGGPDLISMIQTAREQIGSERTPPE
jgi:hypothetical protein